MVVLQVEVGLAFNAFAAVTLEDDAPKLDRAHELARELDCSREYSAARRIWARVRWSATRAIIGGEDTVRALAPEELADAYKQLFYVQRPVEGAAVACILADALDDEAWAALTTPLSKLARESTASLVVSAVA